MIYTSRCQEHGNKNCILQDVITCPVCAMRVVTYGKNNYLSGNKFIYLPWSIPVHLTHELISLMCCLWIVSSKPEGMIPERGILVFAEIQPQSPLLFDVSISWAASSSGFLCLELTVICMSISCPLLHDCVTFFLPIFHSEKTRS